MWPDSSETQELLRRAEGCDAAAVNSLLARHRDALRKMIDQRLDRAVRRRVDASDIAQGVLLEASRRIADYLRAPKMSFQLWLRQIARDQMVDAYRRHREAARRSLDREQPVAGNAFQDRSSFDLAAELRDHDLTPAAAALRQELERRLHAAIETLGDDDREVLLMRHFEQLSNMEVAQVLGVSEPAAGMRHLRALRRLRAVLGEAPSLGDAP
jgi:RNA polymerase sigma-70 factor (ECF subfamily)